jgi:hypothetical protein
VARIFDAVMHGAQKLAAQTVVVASGEPCAFRIEDSSGSSSIRAKPTIDTLAAFSPRHETA